MGKPPGVQSVESRLLSGRSAVVLLVAVTLATFANAWPDVLVLDDRVFVERALASDLGPADVARFFTEDLWAAIGTESNLYRPLLLLSIAGQARLFGDWAAGYHLVAVLLHVLATVLVYGLVRRVLRVVANERANEPAHAGPVALLAALVFGVHPVHAEVVNSVFNSSETMVCIGIAGGLSWFLACVERRAALAWLGLCVVYLLVLLCRESAASLPALAVAALWLTRTEPWPRRLLRCLPAVTMIVPLAIYLALRAEALEPPPAAPAVPATERAAAVEAAPAGPLPDPQEEPAVSDPGPGRAIDLDRLWIDFHAARFESAAVLWFESLKHLAWPHPLQIYYDRPDTPAWVGLTVQLALLGGALTLYFRGHPVPLLGLAFFYLALLPSSRLFGAESAAPGLADRLLYLPSVGFTLVFAATLLALTRAYRLRVAAIVATGVALVFAPLTWARNAEWSSETLLHERDYARLERKEIILNTLLGAHLREGDTRRAVEICDAHADSFQRGVPWGVHCGSAYGNVGRYSAAERAYRSATRAWDSKVFAHFNLGMLYLHLDRRNEARREFDRAVATEPAPFLKAYFAAVALIQMHPNDRAKLVEARSHLERALELQPQHTESREELRELDRRLAGHAK